MRKYLFIVAIIFLTGSCDNSRFPWDSDNNKETAEGKNTLSFTIGNLKINQATGGGFLSPIIRHARYSIDEETAVATILASLISDGYYVNTMPFPEISFTFSSDLLESNAEFNEVETEFWYLYQPQIWHWEEKDEVGRIQIIDRDWEYQLVDVSETKIRIRKWSPEERILAGNFTMTGQYTDSLGLVHPFVVKDGLFDLTEGYYPLTD